MGKRIKVFLIDDHQVVRTGICSMLVGESDIEVVGQSDGGEDSLEQIQKCSPNVILMDIKMPKIDGIQLAYMVKQNYPQCNIIMLTLYDEYLNQAMAAGANGYLLKDVSRDELIEAIKLAYLGETVFSKEIASKKSVNDALRAEPERITQSCAPDTLLEEVQLVVPAPYSARDVIHMIDKIENCLPTRILQIAGSWAEGTAVTVILRHALPLVEIVSKLKEITGIDSVDEAPSKICISSDFIKKITAASLPKGKPRISIFLTMKREKNESIFSAA